MNKPAKKYLDYLNTAAVDNGVTDPGTLRRLLIQEFACGHGTAKSVLAYWQDSLGDTTDIPDTESEAEEEDSETSPAIAIEED